MIKQLLDQAVRVQHQFGWITNWLVVWNMNFIFPYIGNVIIPTDELHHFSEGVAKNHQPDDDWG